MANLAFSHVDLEFDDPPLDMEMPSYHRRPHPDNEDVRIFIKQFTDMVDEQLQIPHNADDAGWLLESVLDTIRGWIGCLADCEEWDTPTENWLVDRVLIPCQQIFPNNKWEERNLNGS